MTKVIPFLTESGNSVKNQYMFYDEDCLFFQSYDDIIAKKDQAQIYIEKNIPITLMSVTTQRWLCEFLGMGSFTIDEIDEQVEKIIDKIDTGEILLIDLNN